MRADHRVLRGVALIRLGRDSDAAAFIALIGRCWGEYGCRLDVDADEPELRALASAFAAAGGALWIADEGDGMVGTRPGVAGLWEICRVYVAPARHGSGLGAALLGTAEGHARERGAAGFELWTDRRFSRAHRFYEKHGYERQAEERTLHDTNGPFVELRYWKDAA